MGKKPKNSAKSANGGASSSPKPAQVGPAPVGGASPVKKGDAKSPIKDTAEKVDRALQRRKSIEEVQDAGILKSPEDAEKLAQVAESIGEKIEARPDQDEMLKVNEHILNPTGANRRLSGVLASTAKELEKKITADKIDRHLGSRPEPDTVLDTNVAPSLQSIQKKLQRQMSSDELSHRLESRPDVQELKDQGIVKEGIAPSLQATQDKLQRQMNADRVHQSLVKRPSLDELSAQGLLDKADTQLAPSLTATAKKLERNLVQNHVAHLLETRPDKDELVSSHILEADNLISPDEKARLKDLILTDDEKVIAAIECYELDQDIEEMLDTLYRVAKLA
ncbi:hypothetical protein ATCC90586_001852 [Pythium insidiosum]|nr:hypothetical protein ATCC90586_001852 [Pythium insidiosum]